MALSWWQRWLRRPFDSSDRRSTPNLPRLGRPLALEALEDRTLLNAGALDATFGNGGIALGSFGMNTSADAVAVQPDGKVVVAGMSSGVDTANFVVARYTSAGVLDTSFGNGGQASVWFNLGAESFEGATGVVIQPDGKIVVVGTASSIRHSSDFALARLNADGKLDSSFGNNGTVLTSFGSSNSNFRVDAAASAVALQRDGKIVVAGSATFTWENGPPPPGVALYTDFAVARYNSNGQLDHGFGTGGEVLTAFNPTVPGHPPDQASGVVIQKDGKIVVIGTADGFQEVPTVNGVSLNLQIQTSQIALARYNPNGRLDTSFGNNGLVLTSIPNAVESTAADVALTPDGEIMVAGSANGRFVLVQYTTQGKLDTTFGTGGIVRAHLPGTSSDAAAALVITPQDQIVVAGTSTWPDGHQRFVLARYTAGGTLDSQFGTKGVTVTGIGTSAGANGVALQPDGSMVVAGSALISQGGLHLVLARYLGDLSAQAKVGPGIEGVAMLQGISPVSRAGVPNGKPLAGAIILVESPDNGTVIARVVADQEGRFRIHLSPGRYKLVPLPPQSGAMYPRGTPQTVVVHPGTGFTAVTVNYFSGIV
jgi:uncharacterized delta-60 repeat protein